MFLKKYKEEIYYVLVSYFLVWIFLILYLISNISSVIRLEFYLIFIAWIPNIAASIVVGITRNIYDLIELLKPFVKFNIGLKWYVISIFLFPILSLLALGILYLFYDISLVIDMSLQISPYYFLTLLLVNLLYAPLGEEAGWRGFLLTKLKEKMSDFKANIIIGFLWSFWNIPLFFLIPRDGMTSIYFGVFLLFMLAVSPIFAWIYNSTKSLFAILILHLALVYVINIFSILGMINGLMNQFFIILSLISIVLSFILYNLYGYYNLKSN